MKNPKELKKSVIKRMMCCWGENAAIFFISVGGAAAILMAWAMTVDYVKAAGYVAASERKIDLSNGIMLAVTAAAVLLLWAIAVPFFYGVKWYRLQQIRGNSVHARGIFSCYSSWRRAGQVFRLTLALYIRRLYFVLPLAALMAAGVAIVTRIEANDGSSIAYSAAAVLIFLLAGCVVCAGVLLNYKYAAVPYIFTLDPDAPPSEIIAQSKEITKGRADYLMETVLSAAGWLIPCIFIFPAVFAVPYVQMIYTSAINELITDGESKKDGKRPTEAGAEEYAHY